MKIIPASFDILDMASGPEILKKIELAGRACYKSEDKITDNSAEDFVRRIIKSGHESVLEHASATVRIIADRGFLNEITVIKPCFWRENTSLYEYWYSAMRHAEDVYLGMLALGATPQEARSVLPMSLKTEMVITANMREWRHIFKLRCAPAAHPQMREIMLPLLEEMYKRVPVLFEDLYMDMDLKTAGLQ